MASEAPRWPEALLLLGEAEATVQANVIILSAAISACEKALPLPPVFLPLMIEILHYP